MKSEDEVRAIRTAWYKRLAEAPSDLPSDLCNLVIKVLDEVLGD